MPERAKSGHPGGPMGGADFMALLYTEFLRVDPKDMAWGIGGRQFYPYLLDYAKQHPCEAVR